MIICNQCGAPVKDAARFCKECGAAVLGTPHTARQTAPLSHFVTGERRAPDTRPSLTVPLALGGGILAVLLLLLGISAKRSASDDSSNSVNSSSYTNTLNSSSNYSSNNTYANAGGNMNRGNMNRVQANTASPPTAKTSTTSGAAKWVVILSGNATLGKALDFARSIEAHRPIIYLREGLYRTTVGPYGTKEIAMRVRDQFRVEIIGDAYVENIDTWCRNPQPAFAVVRCD